MDSDQRSLSLMGIAAFVTAFFSLGAMLLISLWPLAPLGVAAAALGLSQCRRYELLGARWAFTGLFLSLSTLIAAPAWHFHLYRSECAADHLRLDFAKIMRGPQPSIQNHVGRRICVKGYAAFERPSEALTAFALSTSGGNLVGGDFVDVHLAEGVTWDSERNAVAVSGTLVQNPDREAKAKFLLIDATVRAVRTPFDLAQRSKSGC